MGNQTSLTPSDYIPSNFLQNGVSFFDAQWEVGCQIGSGKFSQVFLCWRRTNPKEKFALKVISTDCDEIGLQRIHEEIQIMKELGSHPGILELVDVDEVGMPGYIRFLIFKFHYLCLKS